MGQKQKTEKKNKREEKNSFMKLSVYLLRRHSIRIIQKSKILPPVLSSKYIQSYIPDIDKTVETKEEESE